MLLFYSPDTISDVLELDTQESRHLIKVLRKNKNDIVHVTDGKGNMYQAIIANPNPNKCLLSIEVLQKNYAPLSYHLAVAIAPTKNMDRLEWFLEKATEIGISEVFLFESEHSERSRVNMDRLQKVMIAAMKQSLAAYLPNLHELRPFRQLSTELKDYRNLLAHCVEDVKQTIKAAYQPQQNHCIWIGPEGDFSLSEIEWGKQHNFIPISLGNRRLRTETAGIYAVNAVALLNQEL